ncbi:rod shape-determining protein MreC [Lysobacter niastensis]|uniref:Cell shape-determining protein MreC n=1 Tax=Lysobacter niastensis TaxID=380629 RepID=A0ABU1WDL7_9GAMM|nr:rod shape-determining protein MreC [Lysobacter niastensis]MDR7135445.1 rod shape-determining protein MreC [Lysobacter niastensis]
MPPYAGPPTAARTGEVAGTLRLLAYLALSVVLILLDHRGGWLSQARQQAALMVQPLWMLAGLPGRIAERISDDAGTLGQLTVENRRLREELLLNQARMARLQTLAADNARLRGLLDAAGRGNLDVILAPVLDIDLDPTRQRLVLDAGNRDRVQVGQSVIDNGGLLGQIIGTTPMHANVLLITDPSHAVPVAIARNGVRLVAYGEGRSDVLRLSSVPLSSDVKVGDVLVTSGLGGRFPAGFPVGTITRLHPDDSRAFLEGDVRPAAKFDRGREVLVLLSAPVAQEVAPFDSSQPTGAAAGATVGTAVTAPTGASTVPAVTPAKPMPSKPAASAPAGKPPIAPKTVPSPAVQSPATTQPTTPKAPPTTGEERR